MKDYNKLLLSSVRSCVSAYEMIADGDRVLCAVSGGKDSLAMTLALSRLSLFYPVKYTVSAVTVDMGFDGFDLSPAASFMKDNNIPYDIIKTDIYKAVEALEKPCSVCSRMRRGALCAYAAENGFTKLALGHTEDDLAQTALMNLLYGGRFEAFSPVTTYEDRGFDIIRPLYTTGEKNIVLFIQSENLPVIKNPCGADKDSQRQAVRDIISQSDRVCRGASHRIALALKG